MKVILIFALISAFALAEGRKKAGNFATRFVKIPTSLQGFNYDKLIELKKRLGENKWVRLKHLFLLNPHLPILALTGHHVTLDDVTHWPSWMSPPSEEEEGK